MQEKGDLGMVWFFSLLSLLIELPCFSLYGLCPQNIRVPGENHLQAGACCLLGDAPVQACDVTAVFALTPAWQMNRG